MKKLFTLLTLLLCVCGGAWADTETIFSATPTVAWKVPAKTTDAEITSAYATISGGIMYLTNSQAEEKEMIKKQGNEMAFQHTNNDTFFKVVLSEALQAGDVISARMQSRTDADLGLMFSTNTSRPNDAMAKIVLPTASSQAWVTAPTYTVAEGDGICGESTFYIYRYTGKSTYFNTFTITREKETSDPINTNTFGITNADLIASTGLVTTTTYSGSIVTLTMSNAAHGGSSSTRSLTNGTVSLTANAAACQRNTLCSGASNFVEDSYFGFTMTVASGYKINLSKIYGDLYYESNRSGKFKFAVYAAGSKVWEANSSDYVTTGGSNKSTKTLDVSNVEALQNLTGTVQVRMVWYQNGSSSYVALKDFNCVAAIEEDARTTYAMTVSANDDAMGTVSPENGSTIVEGESVTFTATPNTGFKFVKWTIDGTDVTQNPYTLENVMEEHTAVATFAPLYSVTYDIDDYDNTVGKVLNNVEFGEVFADANGKYTIPTYAHRCLYREGYILSGWSDGTNTYATGDELTLTGDITLTPTWTATTQTLAATTEIVTITWNLAYGQYLFNAWQGTDAVGYYTKPQAINGETIAVPMIIDATNGKIDNSKRASEGNTQTNQNTKFTIPAVNGMNIVIAEASANFSSTTIAGSTEYEGAGTKSISYTYTGTEPTIDIVIGEEGQYLKSFKVTYPAATPAPTTITLNGSGYATYSNYYDVEVSGAKAYTAALDVAQSKITCTEITDGKVPAGNGVLIYGEANAVVTLTPTTDAATLTGNDLKATTLADGTLAAKEANGTYYVLSGDTFKKYTGAAFAANKAYFEAEAPASGARPFTIVFGGETTGINTVLANSADSNETFNLAGQRVAAPQKGLYIVGGKKVIVK